MRSEDTDEHKKPKFTDARRQLTLN